MDNSSMQFMAKAATDSYFSNLSEQNKNYLMSNQELYLKEYFKVFNMAVDELKKQNQTVFQPFGEDSLGKQVK